MGLDYLRKAALQGVGGAQQSDGSLLLTGAEVFLWLGFGRHSQTLFIARTLDKQFRVFAAEIRRAA
jgi:hypothetical protein